MTIKSLRILEQIFYKLLDNILVACMAVMFILLLANILLRFTINSSIDIAEELPRFLFIWVTFIGAIIALKENTHINVNILVSRLPKLGKKICWLLRQLLISICGGYIFYGTYLQHDILLLNLSPVMMISMLLVYGVSYISGVMFIIISLINIIRFALGHVSDIELEQSMLDNLESDEIENTPYKNQ
ncbi:TRAP transporter small permease [Providencia huaxiensis]|uniref:TRAP transporter small permease n=1 Tax=Providencia TaxID=586 RepID=UPI000F77E5E1|nr:TRAP transporter small permease [Providencia rettgeri]MBV2189993.1 TRAP transporter small permease [Providencia rettgeri]HEC8323365.1 TRAP transporter small permease [Providencia rettgeri]